MTSHFGEHGLIPTQPSAKFAATGDDIHAPIISLTYKKHCYLCMYISDYIVAYITILSKIVFCLTQVKDGSSQFNGVPTLVFIIYRNDM